MINASSCLMQYKEEILKDWEMALRKTIPAASGRPSPILINTLPQFLDDLSDALSPESSRRLATEGSTFAQEHGGERARSTDYTIDSLLTELKTLREITLKKLGTHGCLEEKDREIINASIDEASKQSAMAFSLVLEGVRQQFIATLTHDLRGPLTAAKANIEMILKYPEKKDQHPHFAVRAIDNIKRVDQMITDLLDVTRVQAGGALTFEMEQLDAVTVVKKSCEELSTIYGDRFLFKCDVDTIPVWWNLTAIRRVIENLGSNAVKYGYAHTPILIRLQLLHSRVILTVQNEGEPVPIEEQETLFQAYKRSQSAMKGTQKGWGLGLALVRGVAEGHSGSVFMESVDSKNTFGIDVLQDPRQALNENQKRE
jgi:signal transduction histidine kinase